MVWALALKSCQVDAHACGRLNKYNSVTIETEGWLRRPYRMGKLCGRSGPSFTSTPEHNSFQAAHAPVTNPRTDHIALDSAPRVNPLVLSTYLDEDAVSHCAI